MVQRAVLGLSKEGETALDVIDGPKEGDEELFAEARAIRDGGRFGSIRGRNSFQRHQAAAFRLLDEMVGIHQE